MKTWGILLWLLVSCFLWKIHTHIKHNHNTHILVTHQTEQSRDQLKAAHPKHWIDGVPEIRTADVYLHLDSVKISFIDEQELFEDLSVFRTVRSSVLVPAPLWRCHSAIRWHQQLFYPINLFLFHVYIFSFHLPGRKTYKCQGTTETAITAVCARVWTEGLRLPKISK